MALKSSREGLRKELVDYLGNIIVDDNLRNEIVKAVGDKFVTPEVLNENVNNLTMQITTESGERIEADDTLQNNITAEATAREGADTILQNNIDNETTARQEAITNLESMIGTSGLQMDLLWTNASPTSSFGEQSIILDLSSYKFVYIVVLTEANKQQYEGFFILKDSSIAYNLTGLTSALANLMRYRCIVSSSSIYFNNGYNTASSDNSVMIPYQIYGVK